MLLWAGLGFKVCGCAGVAAAWGLLLVNCFDLVVYCAHSLISALMMWTCGWFFLIVMNISQNPLYHAQHILLSEQNQTRMDDGMLDIASLVTALGLCALPFIFMGYVRSRVRHALKTAGKA